MKKKFFDIAYKEALIGFKCGEVPVGCVIVFNDNVIAKAHNMKEKYNDPTAHAEIIAIKKAVKVIGDWRLKDCVLYSTMKPCMMCMGAIKESRISKVYYLIDSEFNKEYYNKISCVSSSYLYNESLNLLKNFFESKR